MTSVEHKTVEPEDDGIRLDRWFKRHYPELAFGALSRLLRKGRIRLDGRRAKPGERIAAGQRIRIPPIQADARASAKTHATPKLGARDIKDIRRWVLYEDAEVIVLNKPPGIPTQGGSGVTRHIDGLLDGLKRREDEPRPKLVHRLDKDTSGVLCVARTAPAAAALSRAMRGRDAHKLYWALVVGVPSPRDGTIAMPLAKRAGKGGERVEADEAGRSARTRYVTREHAAKKAAWLALEPMTGRTHQLRVHCAEISHPIVGDGKYGGRGAFLGGQVSNKLHLHARRLRLPHPGGGEIDVTAPLPAHMRASWELFGWDAESPADFFEPT